MDRQAAIAALSADVDGLVPAGAEIIDAHTHLGLDEDGRSLTLEQLVAALDAAGARRACVFPLHDPDRRPAYRVPNDRVLEWAAASDGRLVPFCRLDPADGPIEEARRALAAGARGIKLHPRAQHFGFDGDDLADIFALAEAERVPILIHTGRGLPPIADGLAALALAHPGATLILAHAAIADQGELTARLAGHPRVLYDTSTWSPFDVLELLARVPIERVVFASDPPYGNPVTGLFAILRVARAAGLDEDALRLLLGGTMGALLDSGELPTPTPPRGPARHDIAGAFVRIYGYLLMSGPALFSGQLAVARGSLSLALSACRDPGASAEQQRLRDVLAVALDLLDRGEIRPVLDLVHRCLAVAATARD